MPTAPEHISEIASDAQWFEMTRIIRGGIAYYVEMSLAGSFLSGAQIINEMRLSVPR